MKHPARIGEWTLGEGGDFLLIAGPCVIESEAHVMKMAEALKKIADDGGARLLFKASYDKANRTSVSSFRGPGLEEGLRILSRVKQEPGLQVLSDVHGPEEVGAASKVLDVIQTPAFLCRQTDYLTAVGRAGKPVNIKKGQFLAPWDMKYVIEKVRSAGCTDLFVTERGACFGYNQLVSDMRSLSIMKTFGFPVVFDATHSVQLPGGEGGHSGGQRDFVFPLARAAVAVGIDGVFVEVHDQPERALCDGPNSIPLDQMGWFLEQVLTIHGKVREWEP